MQFLSGNMLIKADIFRTAFGHFHMVPIMLFLPVIVQIYVFTLHAWQCRKGQSNGYEKEILTVAVGNYVNNKVSGPVLLYFDSFTARY